MKRGIARFLSLYGVQSTSGGCRWILSIVRLRRINGLQNACLPARQAVSEANLATCGYRILVISLILFSLCRPSWAQWTKTLGGSSADVGNSIQQTSDGGYILTGYTASFGAGGDDVLVLRLDSSGNIVWQKTFGGASGDVGRSIQQTSDGGYILAGYTGSLGAGGDDILVLRLDSNGNIVWQKTFGGSSHEYGQSIWQTSDGGYILAGYTYTFAVGATDVLVLRLDSSGNIVWQRTLGGSNYDWGYSIQQTSDGGYILTGYTNSFGAGLEDILVLRLDSSGNIVWQKTYGGSNGNDRGYSIQQTSDGGYVLTGNTTSFGAGGGDVPVLRLDSSGNIVWQKVLGTGNADESNSIQQTSDGGYTLTGRTAFGGIRNYDATLLKLDSNGNVIQQRTFGGTGPGGGSVLGYDAGNCIQETSDGGYILAGYTNSFGAGNYDALVMKLDADVNISGCLNFGTVGMAGNAPSFTVNNISSTVTSPNVSVANVSVTVSTPASVMDTLCAVGNRDDLIVDFGNFNDGINVYYNNAALWTSLHHWGPGAYNMVIGDLDGNGRADLIVDFGYPWGINVLHNNGPFTSWTRIHNFSPGPGRMVVGDLDGNGQDDLIVDFGNFNAGINVYYNNSGPWTSLHPFGPGQGRMVVGDMDGNGKKDLIVDFGNFNAGINVYYNNAVPWTSIHPYSPGMGRMVTGDLDGNGKADLIVDFGNFNAGINVYYNNAAPWTSVHPYGPGAYRMVTGDMDRNGKADLIVDFGDFNAGINVYYNNAAPWTSRHHWGPGSGRMTLGDMDGGGKKDLVVDFGSPWGINVLHNNGTYTGWTRIYGYSPGEGRMVTGNMDGN
ncbi:MAG: VCBS repeat-containing protein [Planctomycetes bacterium]|nr:VCBS repeat-containing protein [Planctomycetota bacterium]